MVLVKARPDEDSQRLIARFRKQSAGITDEAADRKYFKKKSEEKAENKQRLKRLRKRRRSQNK